MLIDGKTCLSSIVEMESQRHVITMDDATNEGGSSE